MVRGIAFLTLWSLLYLWQSNNLRFSMITMVNTVITDYHARISSSIWTRC